MSRPPWTPGPAGLKRHPQLAALAALDHQLRLVVGALAAVHEGQDDNLPGLHQARGIAHVARPLQSQTDAYRRLVAAPPKAADDRGGRNPGRT